MDNSWVTTIFNRMKSFLIIEKETWKEINTINIQRILYISLVMMLVHLAHIILFLGFEPGDEPAQQWAYGIILAHGVMLLLVAIFSGIAYFFTKSQKIVSRVSFLFQGIVVLSYFLFGVIVCTIDQLVTPQITPFLVAAIGLAVGILIHPILALVNYTLAFLFFYQTVEMTQTNPELLLSIRVNSITAIGIGFGLTLMFWRIQLIRIRQQNMIEQQNLKLQETNSQLEFLANRDALTGIYNRMFFMKKVNEGIADQQNNSESSIIVLDLDHFKMINDQYGHPVGDKVLVAVANILKNSLQGPSIVARIGGEEFIIWLPNAPKEEGLHLAEKLRQSIEATSFVIEGNELSLTASFGVATLRSENENAIKTSYSEADKALYQAKQNGRNRVEVA